MRCSTGPGFDVLGLSLSVYLTLDVHLVPSSERSLPVITCSGEGANEAPRDPYKNLITRVALYVLRCHDIDNFPSKLSIHVHNEIPFGRGMGSSGAAVIAGVLLGDAVGKLNLTQGRRLDCALMIERHPDNVAAALLGGFVGSYLRDLSDQDSSKAKVPLAEVLPEYPPDAGEDWGKDPPRPPMGIGHCVQFGWAKEIKAITIIPRFELSTAKARGALQESYSLKDCVSVLIGNSIIADCLQVFNLQRLAVLTTALTRSPPDADLIFQAMQDKIHQPYRKHLVCNFIPFRTNLIKLHCADSRST